MSRIGQAGALILVASASLSLAGSAAAAAGIQAVIEPDGSGTMIANGNSNPPDQVWEWEACAPDLSECSPFATGRVVGTGEAPAHTVFRATSNLGGSATSPEWLGRLQSRTPPAVAGEIRVNELVAPLAGEWSGGWDGDERFPQLAACESAAGTGCITLTDWHYPDGCPADAAVIDRAFEGDYLRVAERVLGPHPIFAGYAVASPFSEDRVLPVRPDTSASIVGRIAPAAGPRVIACGPPEMPFAKLAKTGSADVECIKRCRVVLRARRGATTERVRRTLTGLTRETLELGAAGRRRFAGKRVEMRVLIDGRREAARAVRLR